MEQNSLKHPETPEPSFRANSDHEPAPQFGPASKSKFNDAEYKRWSETLHSAAAPVDN
jgi:hypothetical protein